MTPLKKAVVIFDEIDQMAGANSFYLEKVYDNQFNGDGYETMYLPKLIKKWPQFICLSGTIENDV